MGNENQVSVADRRRPSLLSNTALILVIIALLTLGWQWITTQQKFSAVEKTLSQRLENYQALNQQSLALAKQAEERSTQANARTVLLEEKIAESRDQQEVLQTLYNQLAENREATAVAEVEQLLTIANQQLQLAGNIKAALLALEAADKRLQPLALPRASQLRQTLALEIENLRKLPQVDISNISLRLERLSQLSATLPLISERQPTLNASLAELEAPQASNLNAVEKVVLPIWRDIKNLVTVERIDKPEPPLLPADNARYLRENIKLRLLTARIALLQRDEATYKADLTAVVDWLNLYYDGKHPKTKQAIAQLKELSNSDINIELPQLNESIGAVNRYKQTLEDHD
ncbi:MAG: heme biosynthesis operon protein HemX [Methylotenera sp.]|nr:MAG: heme biosynthesis operon protein HemX [Methylotenera sp.]